ncbi:hypothetical protein GCM10027168_26470 [Streptomyces capparidis]
MPEDVCGSRLLDVLAPAVDVLDQPDVGRDLVVELRVLVDALAPPP